MRARHWTLLLFLIATSVSVTVRGSSSGRRILHQPLFPAGSPPPPAATEGFGVPAPERPFFTGESAPDLDRAVSPPAKSAAADGGGEVPSAAKPAKTVAIGTSVGVVTLGMLSALAFFLYRHRKKHAGESQRLVGDGDSGGFGEEGRSGAPPPASFYVGTVEPHCRCSGGEDDVANASSASPYHKLGSMKVSLSDRYRPSPELQPLPPLDPIRSNSLPVTVLSPPPSSDEDTEFFTPRGTPGSQLFHPIPAVSGGAETATGSVPHSKRTNRSLLAPPPPPPPIPINHREKPRLLAPPPPPNWALLESENNPLQPAETIRNSTPPPPPPPPALLSTPKPTNPIHREEKPIEEIEDNAHSSVMVDTEDTEGAKPRLKPLHWDKVRATSDRATVWDKLKSSSFQLNEDMMETLFGCSTMNNPATSREPIRRSVLPPVEKENKVLDPKKSQNIAILLRALNITQAEVSEALLNGDPESLGVELLESLVKMAPTKEEEIKLRDYNGDVSKLGSAEQFLKAVLDIPFAFKRVETMLYRGNFDSEVKYLRSSFQILEAASEELKNSRLFLKLLEAVLRTGNRMNIGTNRGDAKSFKLDTLLKLVDIKGTDGKTTLLHFVVQEIIRTEGENTDSTNERSENKIPPKTKEGDFRKQGLQVVAGLGRDLTNVKKAAGMDSDVLSSYVSKLETGLEKVRLVLQHEKTKSKDKFFDSMKLFLKEAEEEISQIKEYETKALSHVKDVTRYFHGNAAREEPHLLRIFMIVRDFLSVLDNVCKEVGRMQDRTMVGSARSFRRPETASLPVLNSYNVRHNTSSDEENSSP